MASSLATLSLSQEIPNHFSHPHLTLFSRGMAKRVKVRMWKSNALVTPATVRTAVATAIAATAAAIATTAPVAAAALFARLGFVHGQWSTFVVRTIQGVD